VVGEEEDEQYPDDERQAEGRSLYANIDQTWERLVQELVWTMFEQGAAALVAVDTSADPLTTDSYDIDSLRVGRVTQWYPRYVEVDVYDDREGRRRRVILPKEVVAIVNNPLYEVMNKPNSDLQRLINKLSILDAIDKQSGSGKLDVLIQLPYVVNSELRSKRARARQIELEQQMDNSKYGFAFLDPGGQVIQLNRASTNNLMDQVTWLTNQVYSSLGVGEETMALSEHFRAAGILVRPFAGEGVRVSIGTTSDNERVLAAAAAWRGAH